MNGRLVIGMDGSQNSRKALSFSVELARAAGMEIVAVHAVGLLARLGDGTPVPAQPILGQLEKLFRDEWCAALADSGVAHRFVQVQGDPVDVIRRVTADVDASLCVVGRRGDRPHPEIVLGSTSLQLAEASAVPVLIVPPVPPAASAAPA